MKRILTFALAIMLCVGLAVPALAVDDGYYDFNGHVLPLPEMVTPEILEYGSGYYSYLFWHSNTGRYVLYTAREPLIVTGGLLYSNFDGSVEVAHAVYEDGAWGQYGSEWVEYDGVIMPFLGLGDNVWHNAKCTGETCPATDANMDNVCDVCGMTFAVLRDYSPDGWPTAVPAPPAQYETMILLTDKNQTWLYMVDEPISATITDANDDGERILTLSFSADNTVQRYMLTDSGWAYSSVNSLRSFKFDDTLDFDFSTVDILDVRGNPFFPLPLWVEMGQVTQGEMPGMTQTTVGTITTLTLCGVGLIALLVVLKLFGKRSLIYRG